MDLEKNIIDNIIECQLKLGQGSLPISFYYPVESLLELLACNEDELDGEIEVFKKKTFERLGQIKIEKMPNENGRYEIKIPSEGVLWVADNFKPSEFIKKFVEEIRRPQNTLEAIIKVFNEFSNQVIVRQVSQDEWAIYFADDSIDAYVYHIEENEFGLEYHRFTHKAYEKLVQ